LRAAGAGHPREQRLSFEPRPEHTGTAVNKPVVPGRPDRDAGHELVARPQAVGIPSCWDASTRIDHREALFSRPVAAATLDIWCPDDPTKCG
jgi:hypothetical protein